MSVSRYFAGSAAVSVDNALCPLTSRTRTHARTLCRCAFNDNTCVFYTDLSIDRRNLIQPVGEKPPHKEWVNIQNPARGVTKCVNEAVNSVVQYAFKSRNTLVCIFMF